MCKNTCNCTTHLLNLVFSSNHHAFSRPWFRGCSTCHHWNDAFQLCQEISQCSVRCDAHVFSNVMTGMGRMVQWRQLCRNWL